MQQSDYDRMRAQFQNWSDQRFAWADDIPCLNDDGPEQPYDPQYLLHVGWAARVLAETKPTLHYDFGSWAPFLVVASAIAPIVACDLRQLPIDIQDLFHKKVDMSELHESDRRSVSCLHTLEHVGLGRYGDKLDAQGDIAAAWELTKILAPGGHLMIVLPLARKARIHFNAHRIYTYELARNLFPTLYLLEFSLCLGNALIRNASPGMSRVEGEAAGCFLYTKQ